MQTINERKCQRSLGQRIGTACVLCMAVAITTGLAGCALFQPPAPAPQPKPRNLSIETDRLQQQITIRDKEIARLQLQALEQNARISELAATLDSREHELKETRTRLQRAENRFHALTGPAQTAAMIAEAEAAYQMAASQGKLDPAEPSAGALRQLLSSATAAWEAGDYASAANTSDQVMRRLSKTDTAQRSENRPSTHYPEQALENPVDFRIRVDSHVRGGPGMGFAPLTYLPKGTLVTGLATRGRWVKIRGPEIDQGWIYSKLLAVPD